LARSAAIVQMIAFHAAFDLNHFGWIHVQMLVDPFWVGWRSLIVGQFLAIMGIALGLEQHRGQRAPNWRRWRETAACALLVSLSSYWLFGPRWIWFGVLHFAACTQALSPAMRRLSAPVLFVVGLLAIAAGASIHLAAFDAPPLACIGLAGSKPATEDYVPLLPWLGVVCLGMAGATAWQRRFAAFDAGHQGHRALVRLSLPGRWPLTVYMVHQPLLFGALSLVAWQSIPH
jgi:uncharacterized membrane protein